MGLCYSPAGRSVLWETVPEVLNSARGRRPRAVLRPTADRPRPVNNIFIFSYWDLKVSGNFTSASNLCELKKGAFVLMLFKARDRFQTKPKHYNMIFNFITGKSPDFKY